MEGNDLVRWLTLKQAAFRGNLWAQEDRHLYVGLYSPTDRSACRRGFINWSAWSADKTATAMFYMGLTEEDQFYV